MEKTVLGVDGMSCQHCVKAVTAAVSAIPGVSGVAVELENKTVTARHDAAVTADMIKSAIVDQGYDIMSSDIYT